jgi:hypothetical protein
MPMAGITLDLHYFGVIAVNFPDSPALVRLCDTPLRSSGIAVLGIPQVIHHVPDLHPDHGHSYGHCGQTAGWQ